MQKIFIRTLCLSSLFFSNLWSMANQISNVLDLARNITLVSPTQQPAGGSTPVPSGQSGTTTQGGQPTGTASAGSGKAATTAGGSTQATLTPVVHDMQNQVLGELNITVGNSKLLFVSVPAIAGWSKIPLISSLSFVPAGTNKFTISIYGYNGSTSTQYDTLSKLQAAIASNQQAVKFAAYVYDENGNPIRAGVDLPASLVTSLIQDFAAGTMPTSALGVNSQPIPGAIFSYPISLTLENIGNWGNPVHDMQNQALKELNIEIGTTELTFITSPGANFPLISDLGFIPTGTTSFILEVYGYNNSSQPLKNLKDLQAAITSGTIGGFAVQIYDVNDNLIGNPIQLSSDLVSGLKSAFTSGDFTSIIGVNSAPIPGTVVYPISLTLENISGWTSSQQATPSGASSTNTQSTSPTITTLSQYVSTYSIPSVNQVTKASPSITEFNFNVNGNQTILPGQGGWPGAYAFIKDPWNNVTTEFSSGKGVSAVIPSTITTVFDQFNSNSIDKVSLALLATDDQGNSISDLTKTVPKTMDLYVFDQNGNIVGSPVSFPASNAVGMTTTPKFTTNALAVGLSGAPFDQVTYPFVITITNPSSSVSTTSDLAKFESSLGIESSVSVSISTEPVLAFDEMYNVVISSNPPADINDGMKISANIPNLLPSLQAPYYLLFVAVDKNDSMMKVRAGATNIGSYVLYVFDQTGKNLTTQPITLAQATSSYPLVYGSAGVDLSYIDASGNSSSSSTAGNYPLLVQVTA